MELGERCDKVLNILLQGASSNDEGIALQSLEAGYRSAAQRKILAPVDFEGQLERVLLTRSPFVIHLAVTLLRRHRAALTENAMNMWLEAAANVEPESTRTISYLDHASYQLVEAGLAEKVTSLLSEIFHRSKGRIALDAFQSTYHAYP